MMTKPQPHWLDRFASHETRRILTLVAGWAIIVLSVPVGALPGPGGIFVFAFGLALVLRNSRWAKRQYVYFKRKRPRIGHWMDKGLRRKPAPRGRQTAASNASRPATPAARHKSPPAGAAAPQDHNLSKSRNLEVRPRQGTTPLPTQGPLGRGAD